MNESESTLSYCQRTVRFVNLARAGTRSSSAQLLCPRSEKSDTLGQLINFTHTFRVTCTLNAR